jgi:hypothetical protein
VPPNVTMRMRNSRHTAVCASSDGCSRSSSSSSSSNSSWDAIITGCKGHRMMVYVLVTARRSGSSPEEGQQQHDWQCWLDCVRGGRNRKYAVSTLSYAFSLFAESTYISRVYVVYTYICY